jgi:hypothetical protein
MADAREVTCRTAYHRALWFFVGLGAGGAVGAALAGLAAAHGAYSGRLLDVGLGVGRLLVPAGIAALRVVVTQVSADAYGPCSHSCRYPTRGSLQGRQAQGRVAA